MAHAELLEPVIRTARDAASLFERRFVGAAAEMLLVAHLDHEGRVLKLAEEHGTATDVVLPMRSIIGQALRLGSASLILAHCHPSGDPSPSEADIAATRRLALVASELGIGLHDHLIYGGGSWVSLRGLGLL